jgi:hypothetical protein
MGWSVHDDERAERADTTLVSGRTEGQTRFYHYEMTPRRTA